MADRTSTIRLAEQRLVQGLLQRDASPSIVSEVLQELRLDYVTSDKARVVLSAIAQVHEATGRVSPEAVVTVLQQQSGAIQLIGGPEVVLKLAEPDRLAADPLGHLRLIKAEARRRELSKKARKLAAAATDDWPTARKIASEISSDAALVGDGAGEAVDLTELVGFADRVDVFAEEVPTPFRGANKMISRRPDGGLPYSAVVGISARTNSGKSTLLMTFLLHYLLKLKLPAGYVNFEMASDLLYRNLFAGVVGRDPWRAAEYKDFEAKRKQFKKTVATWKKNDLLYLRNQSSPNLDDVIAFLNTVADHGVRVVFLDTVNRVRVQTRGNRWEMMVTVLQRLEECALRRGLCLICACQENRQQDKERKKKSHRPLLSDIADSSEIEKVSAVILQLHRPRKVGLSDEFADHSELYVTKSRVSGGHGGFCRLSYDPDYRIFRERLMKGREEMIP